MKTKLISLFLLAAMLLSIFSAAYAEAEPYTTILDSIVQLIESGGEDTEYPEGMTGIWEAAHYLGTTAMLDQTGYALIDLTGDGADEFVIAEISDWDGAHFFGSQIYAVYSLQTENSTPMLEGWARNRWMLLQDGTLLNEGSGGASYTIFATWQLTDGGMEPLDYFFSWPDISNEQVIYFHNCIGQSDLDASEQLELTDEQFWQLMEDNEARIAPIELTPLTQYAANVPSFLRGQWLERIEKRPTVFTEFLADTNSELTKVLLAPTGLVTDFRFLKLEFRDFTEESKLVFDETTVFSSDRLTPDRPLIAGLTFIGEIPNYGFRYTDDAGADHFITIGMSGYDGSLLLVEE